MAMLTSRNPATGETIKELETTPLDTLGTVFSRARDAQRLWAALPSRTRSEHLYQLRETLLNQLDPLIDLIAAENGKPRMEAMTCDLLPSVQLLGYFAKRAPRLLRDRPLHLTLMRHRRSYLSYWPLGIVAVISPWNFPFLIPFADIVMALVAGNAVVFKPSEVTPLIGLRIQELLDTAGFPPHLLQTVVGGGELGAAIIQQKPNKVFFTGSVATGKRVMAAAAEHLIPVNLELGGKDPMIVLPDAELDHATSAALWGAFMNAGQVCASVERILVHESIAPRFVELLRAKISQLRQGPALGPGTEVDLGPITFEGQKETYDRQLREAREKGATVVGGAFSPDRRFLQPTLVLGENVESLEVYREETFGPIVAVTTYRSVSEAIEKANSSRYGLAASIMTRDLRMGESVAKRVEAGSVSIDEVAYTAGLVETPWGGVKDSGFGRTHSELGLYEFVNTRHIHRPRNRLSVFKSLWWFPYNAHQYAFFRNFFELFRRHLSDRIRAFPHVLVSLVQFLKRTRRI
jgi:acyl-CoA reductase-like NAD-dependent aldehyde dehydrogenase